MPISIIILTKNEERFIERCIQSTRWADEHVVLDSGSSDRTREIAASLGAQVYEQPWLGWSAQRSKAISLAKHDWVFVLEADEIVTPELAASIRAAMSKPLDGRDGFSVDRRNGFHGVLMPSTRRRRKLINFVRLFNRRYSAYDPEMKVHEEVRFPGKATLLSGVLLHWRGWMIDDEVSALNRYATIEAEVLNEKGVKASGLLIFIRPILRFLWVYIAKGCFRQGVAGLNYSMIRAVSEYVRYAKLWELQHVDSSIDPPPQVYKPIPKLIE